TWRSRTTAGCRRRGSSRRSRAWRAAACATPVAQWGPTAGAAARSPRWSCSEAPAATCRCRCRCRCQRSTPRRGSRSVSSARRRRRHSRPRACSGSRWTRTARWAGHPPRGSAPARGCKACRRARAGCCSRSRT
ncbi:Os04g0567800, partial [Oryza sativa Japonica Group]